METLEENRIPASEKCRIWKDEVLGLGLCEAFFTTHKFPKHSHDYFVVGLIARGCQSFVHRGTEYHTPTGGMIVLNPGDDHTGVPVNSRGFLWRAVYPTRDQMAEAAQGLGCLERKSVGFPRVRIDDPLLLDSFGRLHGALRNNDDAMDREALLAEFLALLVARHSNLEIGSKNPTQEGWVVEKAKRFLRENLSSNPTLGQVSKHLGVDRFRLIREFNRQLGMPPHAYLDCLRIQTAQQLLDKGLPLAEIALAVGFSDQSHFTKRFKRQIGVTPGKYLSRIPVRVAERNKNGRFAGR